jgi:predicted unusual protein kinase regulating ubiquinone biosynthesis (AarF/ABC1/UbiB family)
MLQLGATASRMAAGGVAEKTRRLAERAEQRLPSALLTRKNAALLADKLSRLRGAAMKLGQMLSLEGDNLLPAEFARALEALQANADRMPQAQVEEVLQREYGSGWATRFQHFDFSPIASASIGQVHRAVSHDGSELALKLQYPGVAESFESDVDNLMLLIKMTRLVPQELDLKELSFEVKRQLQEEVDYERELAHLLRYTEYVSRREGFRLPRAFPELSTRRILATELVLAPPLLQWSKSAPVGERNAVGKRLLALLLAELFEFRFMQTDPNPGNYLFDPERGEVVLLDFGAARAVPAPVSDLYRRALLGVTRADRAELYDAFTELGVIYPSLDPEARDILLDGALFLTEVLGHDADFDFSTTDLSQRMHAHGKQLKRFRNQLRPPPLSYLFFQRKLGGAFLMSRQLGASINCHRLLHDTGLLGTGSPIRSTSK